MSNYEILPQRLNKIRHSGLFRHSDFGIRHRLHNALFAKLFNDLLSDL
jgi:hypothetical protein